MTSRQSVFSVLWGNTLYCVKFSGEDLSRYSNEIESVGLALENVLIITVLLRKCCHSNKHFAELAPHRGGKTAGVAYITSLSPYVYFSFTLWPFAIAYPDGDSGIN